MEFLKKAGNKIAEVAQTVAEVTETTVKRIFSPLQQEDFLM